MGDVYQALEPARLTAIARNLLADEDWLVNQFQLAQWYPNELLPQIRFEYLTGSDRTYSEAARFRNFDVAPRVGNRPGFAKIEGELPPIGIEYPVREYDRIQLMGVNTDADVADLLLPIVQQDVLRGVEAIERRFEVMRRDFLLTGTATLAEAGGRATIDVERDPTRELTVGTTWATAATATPLDDEADNVVEFMLDEENIGPDQMIAMMNSVTWRRWKATDQVRGAFQSVRVYDRLVDDQANQIRRDLDLPDVQINDGRVKNPFTGVVERIIPDGIVIYLPRFPVGSTMYGIPVMAGEPGIEFPLNRRPGPLAYIDRETKPVIYSTVLDALGAPMLKDPDATFVLTT